jgi:3-deoxy-D-manno-octulosonic-acid transferase
MRYLYDLLIYLAAPLAFLLELWRGVRDPSYRERRSERLGFGPRLEAGNIWVHAVSVGEVQASAPLVRALVRDHPDRPVVMTTVTPTGAARCRLLFGDAVRHRYVPLDMPGAVARFFDRIRPHVAIIIETELWPNLYAECGRRGVPLVLASARISPRSVRRYRRLVSLFRETLSHGIVIGAQSRADADRFLSIGANPARTHVTGNIKFDFELQQDVQPEGAAWRRSQAPARPVWVAGSTHEGEESILLEAHATLRRTHPDALLILVPRHPGRFVEVGQQLDRRGVRWVGRASGDGVTPQVEVLLGDTMGELLMFYAAADVAFVAGSLVPVGGHNLLEPAALGKPILTGPHNFNGEDIFQKLLEAGAVSVAEDASALAARLAALFDDEAARREQGARGLAVLEANRGAIRRLLALLEPLLAPAPSASAVPAGRGHAGPAEPGPLPGATPEAGDGR